MSISKLLQSAITTSKGLSIKNEALQTSDSEKRAGVPDTPELADR